MDLKRQRPRRPKEHNVSLNKDETLKALRERLESGLKPGDKVVAVKEVDGFRVYSEFHEVCSTTMKAGIERGTKSSMEV